MGCGKLGGGVGQGTHLITCARVRFWVKIPKRSGSGSVSGAAVETDGGGDGGGW